MTVLLDSCIWSGAKKDLVEYDAKWVGDFIKDPGDKAIMQLAVNENRIIITQDKDFGELAVFRGINHCGIIRLVGFSSTLQGKTSLQILQQYKVELSKKLLLQLSKTRLEYVYHNFKFLHYSLLKLLTGFISPALMV